MRSRLLSFVLTALAAAALIACSGGNKGSNSTTTTTTTTTQSSPAASPAAAPAGSPAASPMATAGTMRSAKSGMLNATPAPIPAGLNCGAQGPVWVNTRSHVYHIASDPTYGRTRRGQYMCLRQAINAGNRAAGTHHGGGAMAPASPTP